MQIDHIGIVVRTLTKGIEHWQKVFGYAQLTGIVVNPRQKVKVVFLHKKNSLIVKLIEPSDRYSPVFQLAMKGGGLHHICFKCREVESELERLKQMGLRILTSPEAGEAFDNEKVAFMYDNQGLTIELIDTDKKAKRLRRDLQS